MFATNFTTSGNQRNIVSETQKNYRKANITLTKTRIAGFILKFTEPNFLQSTKSNVFHFTNINYFRKMESEEKRGVKDPHEIMQVHALNPETDKVRLTFKGRPGSTEIDQPHGTFTLNYGMTNHLSICSFVFLNIQTDFIKNSKNEFRIKSSVITDLIDQFGNRPAILWGGGDFKKLTSNLNVKENTILEVYSGLVNYYSGSNFSLFDKKITPKNIFKIAFKKEEYFKSQREFRLVAYTEKENFDFDLKSTVTAENDSLKVSNSRELADFYAKL